MGRAFCILIANSIKEARKTGYIPLAGRLEDGLPIPGQHYTFGEFAAAQVVGDYEAPRNRKRRVIRIIVREDPPAEIEGWVNEISNW